MKENQIVVQNTTIVDSVYEKLEMAIDISLYGVDRCVGFIVDFLKGRNC